MNYQDRERLLAQIIAFLIKEKAFTPSGAALCAKNFIETMECAGIPVAPRQDQP